MLESLLQTLSVLKPLLGDSLLLFTLAIGIAFAVLIFSVLYIFSRTVSPARRRLLEGGGVNTGAEQNARARAIDKRVAPYKKLFVPGSEKEQRGARKRLMHAGFRGDEALTVFYLFKALLTIGFAMAGGLVAFLGFQAASQAIIFSILGGGLLGILLPSYWLDKKVASRQREIINAFPDVLDLTVACTEAGLGLNAAIQRVARETSAMYPALSSELAKVNSDIRSGADRIEALRAMSTRTGVDDVSGFVSMVSQSIKFGTSIADTLRIYAEEFRDKRMQRAEEMAAKVSTKLIFPLVLCIFPAFFAVAIGPAVLAIVRAFSTVEPLS